ncbi:nitroreductase [Variovorax sp. PAMC 28711]|uniref:nitroreductase n=1 Tax=Variovorax sp. PAMC 28711 TaxID=1795631 RepID=UPI00078D088A|nr:nitroreductase [Variovorax sp. PAMC 28711]AMM23034.1 NADH dehydrogenase [Variovorax sp. PAMC 28711]
MQVQEAVTSRRSIRAFLSTPVSGDVIRRVVATAARAPSGGNLQPWHIDVMAGEPLDALKATMQQHLQSGAQPTWAYDVYPKTLPSPWRDRRFKVGEDMYARLGIPRDDKPARLRWFARNYELFGAPMALFCSVDRAMGPPQWADLGMYLQTVMLLLREEGLDSCAQECWAAYPDVVGKALSLPAGRMLFSGMSIGFRDPSHAVNALVADRAPLDEWAQFRGV